MAKRSWWNDWGDTYEVEGCVTPYPDLPEVEAPEEVETDGGGLQPRIEDLLIFPTNIVKIYFIT